MIKKIEKVFFLMFTLFLVTICMSCTENNETSFTSTSEDTTKASPTKSQKVGNQNFTEESISQEEKIERLRKIVPQKPTIIGSTNEIKIMRDASETKEEEVISLLVKCLAFNYDPDNSNESKNQEDLIPAISIIKEFYGEKAGSSLYKEAISTNDSWLIDRIALAVKVILTDSNRKQLDNEFLKDSANAKVSYFTNILAKKDLQIKFAQREDELDTKIDQKINQMREKTSNNSKP